MVSVPRVPLCGRDVARIVLVTRVQRDGHRQEAIRERGDEFRSRTCVCKRVSALTVQHQRFGDDLPCPVVPFILTMISWWNSKLSLKIVREGTH